MIIETRIAMTMVIGVINQLETLKTKDLTDWDSTCYYKHCGLQGHREVNCQHKANDVYHEAMAKDLIYPTDVCIT